MKSVFKWAADNIRKVSIRILKALFLVFASVLLLILEKKYGAEKSRGEQPIFIIGAPRTGSTVLYQALTNAFNVGYIDNLAAVFYKSLPAGIWLSKFVYGNRPHNNFYARFGNTRGYGKHAPSECGQFWYRWFPLDDHFVDYGEVSEKSIREMQAEVGLAESVIGAPILFKNLNAGQRLRVISQAFPDARIIYVKRDPRYSSGSIIRARQLNNVAPESWWSVKPKNFRELLHLDEISMAVAQVYYLEKQIEEDISLFDSSNVKVLHYHELNEEKISQLGQWLGLEARDDGGVPEFLRDNPDKIDPGLWEKICLGVNKYPFSKDLDL